MLAIVVPTDLTARAPRLASDSAPTVRHELTIDAHGRRLRAVRIDVEAADPGGPTLVFLHEGLGSIWFWKDFPELLCGRLSLSALVYDRWGHGGSEPFDRPRTVRYLHEEAHDALPEVLAAARIERPILIGHSDGGSIALLFAAAFPDRPLAVVTEAAHVLVEPITLAGIRAAVAAWDAGRLRATLERYHGAQAESVFRAWADCWLSPAFRDWSIEKEIGTLEAPLLVLQGADDEYGSPEQLRRIAGAVAGPASGVLIPRCGHVPHHQARAATLELMAGFLEPVVQASGVHPGCPSG